MNIYGPDVLVETMALCRAGDRHDPWLLRQQPGQRELRRCGALPRRERLQPLHEGQIGLAVLFSEARDRFAKIVRLERCLVVDRAGQKTFPKWTERYEPDAEFLERRENLAFGLTPPQGVLALQCRNRLNSVGAADRRGSCLRQAEVLDFALRNEVLDGTSDVFDRHVRVNAMLIEEVDSIGPQPSQRRVSDRTDVRRTAVETRHLAVLDVEPELH